MKQNRNICHRWILSGAAALASVGGAHAFEASDMLVFSKGPVSLRPQFELVEQFTDNVYYLDTDRVADLTTIISPGLRFVAGQNLPTENHFIINYTLDSLLYLNETDLNGIQHRISTDSKYAWTKLSMEGADRIEFLSSALGGGFSQSSREPVDRTVFADFYRFDYRLGQRTGVYVEAQHNAVDYEEGLDLFDSRRLLGAAGFEYFYSQDTRFFGEVYYGQIDLENNASSTLEPPGTTFIGAFVGARGQFTEKLSGRVKAGYEVSEFKGGNVGGDQSAGSAPVVEANLGFQFTDRSNITLSYSRRQTVSVQFVRSAYVADSATIAVSQILGSTGRLKLTASASFLLLDFEPSPNYVSRNDTSWQFDIGASWYFQTWLSTRLAYGFDMYESDLPTVIDYNMNRVTLSLAIGY